jgi:hypothetical protein
MVLEDAEILDRNPVKTGKFLRVDVEEKNL